MKLIAKRATQYAGRRIAAGEAFEATSRHARVLMRIRHAAMAPEAVKDVVEPADRDDVETAEDETNDKPRKYKRRDMTAEK